MNTFYKSLAMTILFGSAIGIAPFSHAEEYNLSYGARLTEANGAPILGQDGKLDLEVSFYNAGAGGSPIGPSPISFPGTGIVNGIFQFSIILTPPEFHQVFQDPSTPVYIEVKDVKSGATFPRQRFSVIPFALKTPIDDDTIVYNGDGKLTVGSSVGTVKQITAGSGLTGGAITDSGTIAVDAGTTGNKIVQLSDGKLPSVDGSNLSGVNAEKLQTRNVSAAVPVSGQVLKWSGSAWIPSSDLVGETGSGEANTASNVTSGSGVGLFKGKVSADLMFYSLSPGAGVTINLVGDDVVIASTITQYTDAMAKAAAVADSITDSVTTIAPSQNAVYDALATKQASVTTSTDLNLNSITTNAINAITVNPGVSTGEIKLKELSVNGANYVGLKAPGSITSDLTLTLPGGVGTNGQFLKTDGSGVLSWADQASAPVSSVNTLTGAVTLTSTNISEGTNLYYTDARAKTAAVGDAITDTITDKAPSQNAVFDALALKSATSHNHSGVYEPAGLSTDVVTTTKILNGAVTAAKIAACSDTQILKMSGANWVCSSDANSGGTVTNVASGTGLTGGPITGTGTLSLATSGVTAGTYTKVTVDTYGRATSGTTIAASDLPSSVDAAKIGGGGVDNTEFGYLDGVTSAVQTQLNGKVAGPASATDNAIARFDGTTGKLMQNSGVVIDDSGSVGIGTTDPQNRLDVRGAITTSHNMELTQQTTGNRYSYIDFHGDDTYTDFALRVIRENTGQNATSKIEHRGTGDLKIWADEAADLRFGTSNSERMVVDDSGNIGIGTTTPGSKLEVSGTGSSFKLNGGSTNTRSDFTLSVDASQASPNPLLKLDVWSYYSTYANKIIGAYEIAKTGDNNQASHIFYTGDRSERMRIDPSGNVGIGTPAPSVKLEVYTSGLNTFYNQASAADIYSRWHVPGVAWWTEGAKASGDFWFTQSTDHTSDARLVIKAGGNIGIGTTNPYLTLDVERINDIPFSGTGYRTAIFHSTPGVNADQPGIQLGYDTSGAGIISASTQATGQPLAFWTYTGSAWGERMRISKDGNVGIGTTSPVTPLHVRSVEFSGFTGTAHGQLNVDSSSNSTNYWRAIDFGSTAGSSNPMARIGMQSTNGGSYLSFGTSNSYVSGITNQAVTIDPSGNVGIGTTSPAQKLQVGTSGDGSVAIANAWNTFSDIRLKRDLVRLPEALNKLEELNGYYYFWKDGEDQSRQVGVVAQEVEQVLPELVKTGQDGIKTVDYPKLTVLLIEAAKQLRADKDRDIAQLKEEKDSDIARLDAENSMLKADVEKKGEDISQLKGDNDAMKAVLCKIKPDAAFCVH